MRVLRTWLLVTALVVVGCATAPPEEEKTPQQVALEKQYQQLQQEINTINGQRSQALGQASNLFKKAGALESKRKLGSSRSLAAVPAKHKRASSQRLLGPVTFKYKKATFKVQESGPGSSGALSIFNLTISR